MNDWRSKTGKHAERVRQEAERAKQASLDAYRKALKSIRTRAPELIASLYRENRASVPLQGIPDELREAVIAIEDDRFYQHHGVDFRGTLRAVLHNLLAGGVVEGGSTITQQLARNMFLTQRRLIS